MKDYKLSECKTNCLRYSGNRCEGCEFLQGYYGVTGDSDCFFGDNRPYSWEIEQATRGQITDTECVFTSYDDWVKENAKEHYAKYKKDRDGFSSGKLLLYTELKKGDIVEILACAPYGMNTSDHKADYKLYLVKKVNGWLEVIGADGIEILE